MKKLAHFQTPDKFLIFLSFRRRLNIFRIGDSLCYFVYFISHFEIEVRTGTECTNIHVIKKRTPSQE
jgi:hypothetical protein